MKRVKALIVLCCMVLPVNCRTLQSSHNQGNKQAQTSLVIVVAANPGDAEIIDSAEIPMPDSIESGLQYSMNGEQSDVFVEEVRNQDIPERESAEPVSSPVVRYEVVDEDAGKRGDAQKKVRAVDPEQPGVKKNRIVRKEYYLQVGSWKNLQYAEEIFVQLEEMYPGVSMVMHNGFHKVRVSGVRSKKQGAVMAQHIEDTFHMKPLLVLKTDDITLDDAVRTFIGTPHRSIDCYGLIVRGLINQGIQYHGQGGIREKLENLALLNGLPGNAYLNGEGLVEKAGTTLFSNSIPKIINVREDTDRIFSEMTPYLKKGIILSFSTTTRGHTGIISRWKDRWTYINSGLIDNQIVSGEISERVGEEFLKAEIRNWVELASSRKEPLTVTLGEIDENHLPDFDWSKTAGKLAAVSSE